MQCIKEKTPEILLLVMQELFIPVAFERAPAKPSGCRRPAQVAFFLFRHFIFLPILQCYRVFVAPVNPVNSTVRPNPVPWESPLLPAETWYGTGERY